MYLLTERLLSNNNAELKIHYRKPYFFIRVQIDGITRYQIQTSTLALAFEFLEEEIQNNPAMWTECI